MVKIWVACTAVLVCLAAVYATDQVEVSDVADEPLLIQESPDKVQEEDNDKVTAERYRPRYIRQGTRVGLRHVDRGRRWVAGWPHRRLTLATCPRLYFSGKLKRSCWGEVFRIYSKHTGYIRVGDLVGLYYVRGRKWLGCYSGNCYLHPCPGYPRYKTGFRYSYKWRVCPGEVLRIAARGKRNGQYIQDHDAIMLQFVRTRREYISGHRGHLTKSSCPGYTFPPSKYTYDRCYGEVFQIKIL